MEELLESCHVAHSRADRDRYVKILEKNVKPGKMGQFAKQAVSPINIFKNPYDYGSILHYSAFAFSKNETFLRTIDTLKPADIGQRYFLSHLDVAKIKHFYQCAEVKDASCTFDFDLCDWTQDYKLVLEDRQSFTLNDSFSDDFDFLKLNSSTLFTEYTPIKDHTTGFECEIFTDASIQAD
uniref:Metalloendopeptidase n=1 Tax=Romanomermis culicivorax TaxID=13658 RepID=A0A915K8D3_ROMCU